jgi:hypothetical protein
VGGWDQVPEKKMNGWDTRVIRNGQVKVFVVVQRVLGASERVGIIVASRGRYEEVALVFGERRDESVK